MEFKSEIDYRGLMSALKKYPDRVSSELRKTLGEELTKVQVLARNDHRYTSRSGQAERATGGMGPTISRDGLTGTLSLDRGIAPYVRRLHEGGGGLRDSLGRLMTNRPDKFLYKAFKRNKKEILSGMRDAVRNAKRMARL